MKKVLSCSIEVFTSAESEVIVCNIPRNSYDPRLGFDSKCFISLEEFVDFVRELPDPTEPQKVK